MVAIGDLSLANRDWAAAALVAAGLASGLTLAVIVWLFSRWWQRTITALEDRMVERVAGMVRDIITTRAADALPDAARQRDVAEAFLFDFARARDYFETLRAKAEHVAAGGSPDDPPVAWKKIRKDK